MLCLGREFGDHRPRATFTVGVAVMPTEADLSAMVNEANALLAELKTLQEDSPRSAQMLDEIERILRAAEAAMESAIAKFRFNLIKNRD